MIFREKGLRICLTPSDQDMKKQSDPTMALGLTNTCTLTLQD
jgi:hypothetical protein